MEIILSSNSSKPIYTQITEQIKAQIMDGTLRAGDPIPSMRSLAKSLHVSVITVQRAYEELQRDGFIETTVGRGSFVAVQVLSGGTAAPGGRTSECGGRDRTNRRHTAGTAHPGADHIL